MSRPGRVLGMRCRSLLACASIVVAASASGCASPLPEMPPARDGLVEELSRRVQASMWASKRDREEPVVVSLEPDLRADPVVWGLATILGEALRKDGWRVLLDPLMLGGDPDWGYTIDFVRPSRVAEPRLLRVELRAGGWLSGTPLVVIDLSSTTG
jgi:hypothetical protein